MSWRERDRQTERDRDRETETETETEKDRGRWTKRVLTLQNVLASIDSSNPPLSGS